MSVSPNQSGRRSLDHKEPRASLRSSLSWAVRPLWGLSESAWNGPRRFRSVQPPAALRLAGSNRDETSPRGLLDESHLTGQQNSLDTNVIGRKPAPEAKFQISRTAGCTALAGPPAALRWPDRRLHCAGRTAGCTALAGPPAALRWPDRRLHCAGRTAGCTALAGPPAALRWPDRRLHCAGRTAGCTALAGPNRDETSVRGLRRIAVEAPGDWRPPNPSPMNPVLGGTQSFASAAENRQVPTHFPGTSIARKPARG